MTQSTNPAGAVSAEERVVLRPTAISGRRLIPLALLVLTVATVGLTGFLQDGAVSSPAAAPAAAPAPDVAARSVQAQRRDCTPTFDPHNEGAPWSGGARATSQASFASHASDTSQDYVRGRDGWYFFGDLYDKNFSQALGRVRQRPRLERHWARYLEAAQQAVSASGGEFHVVVAPANWDVDHRYLPAWAQSLRGRTSLEDLMRDHPELPWIDVRSALSKADGKHRVYEPLNSHWTPYGGWVAWKAITACLRSGATDPALKAAREPALSGVGTTANVNEFSGYGVPDGLPRRTYPIFAQPHPATTITHIGDGSPVTTYPDGSVDTTQLPAMSQTPNAMSPLRLLVLRDSTGTALSPLWDWTFGSTVSYQHGIGEPEPVPDIGALATQYRPDVVLFIITERFLVHDPYHS